MVIERFIQMKTNEVSMFVIQWKHNHPENQGWLALIGWINLIYIVMFTRST